MLFKKIIRRIIKYIFLLFSLGFLLYLLFLAIFIIPNDRRVKNPRLSLAPIIDRNRIIYDLIDLSPAAHISHQDYGSRYKELKQNAQINDNADFHRLPENMHVSLGWYPLKVVHKNCLYAPTPTVMTYELTLPQKNPR
ncbi:MAG: hypothetical protein PHV60_09705, partial [bacterium]|nr:hypothetical protein [bacterium]